MLRNLALLAASAQGLRRPRAIRALAVRGGGTTTTTTTTTTTETSYTKSITADDIARAQKEWGDRLIAIGKIYTDGGDYVTAGQDTLDDLYGYQSGLQVLFKPTKAANKAIRLVEAEAASYFVGNGCEKEDHGFAITPFTAVEWDNKGCIFYGETATAMGEYYFTDAGGGVTKAEYTFQYTKVADGSLKIVVHHSSLPFVKTLPLDPENETTYRP